MEGEHSIRLPARKIFEVPAILNRRGWQVERGEFCFRGKDRSWLCEEFMVAKCASGRFVFSLCLPNDGEFWTQPTANDEWLDAVDGYVGYINRLDHEPQRIVTAILQEEAEEQWDYSPVPWKSVKASDEEIRLFFNKFKHLVGGQTNEDINTPSPAAKHCCDEMAEAVTWMCAQHTDRFECPDALVHYSPQTGDYGIIIHDGGTSFVQIHFCPWCGTKLGAPSRDT
jgi:hypothetical protein